MTDKPQGADEHPHIWLRYATQFTTAGRTHTIEMGIPVPLGASTEMRAQLIREAEAGMNQLSSHVESRVTQMLQRNQRPQGAGTSSIPTPQGTGASAAPTPQRVGASPTPTPPIGPTPPSSTEQTKKPPIEDKGIVVPPTRSYVGASMPLAPGLSGDAGGILTLTQFLHFIKGTLGLTHQQAKDLLHVKTLNGLNLRDALERLQYLVAQNPIVPDQKPQESNSPGYPQGVPLRQAGEPYRDPFPAPTPSPPLRASMIHEEAIPAKPYTPSRLQGYASTIHEEALPPSPISGTPARALPPKLPVDFSKRDALNDQRPPYRFDEEDDLEEDKEMILHDMDEDAERPGLTAEELLQARNSMSRLKEVRGSTTAGSARLTVLQNVVGSQISEEQLQQLLQALWGTSIVKKLKVDQVEALISWAKEDDFVGEVEAVLTLIEEE